MLSQSFVTLSTLSLVLAAPLARRAVSFGSCSNPTIIFANGLDGRTTGAFEPANEGSFAHGSALNIGVIAGFICGQLPSECKAGQDAVALCNQATQAATGLTGQAAADAFNKVITGGSAAPASSSSASSSSSGGAAAAAPPSSGGSDCVATTVTVTAAAADSTAPAAAAAANPPPPVAAAPPPQASAAASSSSSAAGQGGNFQKFTGTLGGSLPPAVTTGDKGFIVSGSDSFINLGAAIQRSCDIQHNQCANKANSGGGFPVSQCDQQDTACVAANK